MTANIETLGAMIDMLAEAKEGDESLSRYVRNAIHIGPKDALKKSPLMSISCSLDEAISAIPQTCWWKVERRKNMENSDMPNPYVSKFPYTVMIGRHTGNSRTADASGAGNTPALAMCSALINLKIAGVLK